MRSRSFVFFAFAIVAFSVACEKKPVAPSNPSGSVIASFGDKQILSQDFMNLMERIEEKSLQVPSTHLQKKEFLEQYINIELLYDEALKQGLDQSFDFKQKLAEVYIDQISRNAKSQITENQLRSHYEKNKSTYDQIAARHILLKTDASMSEKKRVEIFEKISALRDDLLKNPAKFSDYARIHSEDSTRQQGGDLGYFTRDMMVPAFAKAAFDLQEVNEISPVVGTNFGYHIIQLRADRRGFDFHTNEIRELLIRKSQRDFFNREVSKLRKETPVQIYEENLLKLSPLPDIIHKDPEEVLPEKLNRDE